MNNITKLISILTILCTMLFSCKATNDEKVSEIPNAPTFGIVTVIFNDNANELNREMYYFNGYYYEEHKQKTDTISVSVNAPQTYINYFHKDYYIYSYLVYPNDTLFINSSNSLPFATSSNKSIKDMDFNWLANYNLRIQNKAIKKHIVPRVLFDYANEKISDAERISENITMINDRKIYVDSLISNKLISDEVLNLLQTDSELSILDALGFKRGYNLAQDIITRGFDDDLLPFLKYRYMTNRYVSHLYDTEVDYNPVKIFDAVLTDTIISPKTKTALLYEILIS